MKKGERIGITHIIGIASSSFHRRLFTLLTSLICAALVACSPEDSSISGMSLDSFNSTESIHSKVAEENTEKYSGKDYSDNVILEGTLGPEPTRSPLDRSVVLGSDAPEGSDKFVREKDQVLFESDASSSVGAKVLSPESATSSQDSITENEK